MFIGEALRFTWESVRANRGRSVLTALGMVIGTASVILVVTIAMTGQDYILGQIQGVGSNLIYAYYEAGETAGHSSLADYLTLSDLEAIRRDISSVRAAAAIITQYDRMVMDHSERDVTVIGTNPDFRVVRNLRVLSGRFFEDDDLAAREKVCLVTEPLAQKLFGGLEEAVGHQVKIHGLEFTVIGTFKEGVETFGQSEINKETLLIPLTVMKYFVLSDKVDQIYLSVYQPSQVLPTTERVKEVLAGRHRSSSVYRVENLSEILSAAKRIGTALTLVLLLISAVSLIISGIGIMNIMLVTVTERTREIGIKLAVGARRREILLQFLSESLFLSVSGGAVGILLGISVPLAARIFVEGLYIPISKVSVAVAFGLSCLVGVVFGMIPANRASQLQPTEALHYE